MNMQVILKNFIIEFNKFLTKFLELFGSMIPIHVFGFIYAILYLKEVKVSKVALENAAYDNPAMAIEMSATPLQVDEEQIIKTGKKWRNAVMEFFDPQHAIKCVTSLLKQRENKLRRILIIFMVMHMLCNGISQGEAQNLFLYVRSKFSWDVDTYVYHNVFTAICNLVGTSLAVGVLSKLFKVDDIFLVLISTLLSIICRGVYIGATKTSHFFAGTAIDFTFSIKFLAVRSIISKVVPGDDLSTMYAIMGLFEALAGFIFPFIYPTFYQFLLKNPHHDVSEIFMLSGFLLIVAFGAYLYEWYLLKVKDNAEKDSNAEKSVEETTKL